MKVLNYKITEFPQVNSEVFVLKSKYLPVNDLKIEDLKITNGNNNIPLISVVNQEQNPYPSVSLTICFDLATGASTGSENKFNLAKYAAKLFAKNVLNGKSECSLTSFNQFSYINLDFVQDSNQLINSIEDFSQSKTSNYATGLINYPIGAIAQADKGQFKKTLVIITDRKNVPLYTYITELLNQRNIRLYCITISDKVKEEFQLICDSTQGKYFGEINDSLDVLKSVNSCLSFIYGYKPSLISWKSLQNCSQFNTIKFSNIKNSSEDSILFELPEQYRPYYEIEPKYLSFSAVLPGFSKDLDATITAKNSDLLINGLQFTSPYFKVIKGAPDMNNPVLRIIKDVPHQITIRFTPADSALVFDSLIVFSNACYGQALLVTGGFPNTPPKQRNLKLTKPICGETLLIGDTISVEWTGLLPNDVIQLEYSLDGGSNWNVLAKNVNGLKYNWSVPNTITNSCLIRAIQLWPNNVGQTMDLWHRKGVNTANFNEIGDMVVSASSDTTVKVWNSNNGFELHRLIGHTSSVRWANFSPDGNLIITASDDSTVKIWDISNPEEKFSKDIFTLRKHKAEVKSANYSPDGKYIVTASWDGTAKIWDAKTGDFIRDLTRESYRLWYAEFSPDGKYILTVGNSSDINIWKTESWGLYKTLSLNNGSVIHANFSPDGAKVVSAGWFGKALMWNIELGDTLFSVTHSDTISGINPINSASFDYTGKYFLTTSVDKSARMWDAKTGELVKILKEHSNSVQFAVFNFDGSRILTSSWDSTAKIWNLDKRDLQMDSTDCPIGINKVNLFVQDHKLPDVITGQSNQFTLDTFIINLADYPVKIKGMRITGRDTNDFQIFENSLYDKVDSLAVLPLDITFSPSENGLRECIVEIDVPGKTYKSKISGNGFQPEIAKSTDYIDFGKVELGDIKDTTLNFLIKNVSRKNVKILSVTIPGPDTDHFYILDGAEAVTLAPNEGKNFTIRFLPEKKERYNSIISIKYDAYGQEAIIPLLGEG
ncbi:choice-of-anchor D domain-containing protein, partial [Bacteroidetes/Chlorobi group bacterium ChocPot_Mid]